jgi:predicted metal-binding membrane protein
MRPGAAQPVRANLSTRGSALIIGAMVAVAALAWAYLAVSAAHMDMGSMTDGVTRMMAVPWTPSHFSLTALMWAVMMVAMMLPSAIAMVLTYAAVAARMEPRQRQVVAISLFATGYVVVWTAFSLGATALQWALEGAALLSPGMVASGPLLGGALLIVAGLYQWSPLKEFCLRQCRTPLAFLARNWRPGETGALQLGLRHGAYCVGCCWAVMLLLFVGGVMNLLWVAAIAVFVLLEKLFGVGTRMGRWISGGGLVSAGVFLLTLSG